MTAKVFQRSVTDYYATNLARLLGRFFDTPEEIKAFRRVQRDYGMFISGSSGVQFLDNIHFLGSDLDLYVESRHGLAIGGFLLGIGYEYVPRPTQPDQFRGTTRSYYTNSGIAGVCTFCRGGQKVQLITSRGPPLEIVFLFHSSTCSRNVRILIVLTSIRNIAPPMNLITYDRVYSLYPKATFEERRGLIVTQSSFRGSDESNQYGLQKYRDRGWTLSSVTENHVPKSDLRPGLRWVGDGRCLSLRLAPIEGDGLFETTEAPSSIPTLQYSSWTVKPSRFGANTVDFDVRVLSLGDFRYAFSAATHLGRIIQSPSMTQSLQWATGWYVGHSPSNLLAILIVGNPARGTIYTKSSLLNFLRVKLSSIYKIRRELACGLRVLATNSGSWPKSWLCWLVGAVNIPFVLEGGLFYRRLGPLLVSMH